MSVENSQVLVLTNETCEAFQLEVGTIDTMRSGENTSYWLGMPQCSRMDFLFVFMKDSVGKF